MSIWHGTTVALLGLCLGSFANVLIHRLPRGIGVVRGRSACPRCGVAIAWFDNVPLVSWLVLGGRCRRCRGAIGWRYPLVELGAGLLALGCALVGGASPGAASAFLFLYLLAVIAIIDWRHMIIPHTLTVSGMVAGLLAAEFAGPGLGRSLLGLALGAGVVLSLSEGYRLLRGQAGMGGGDVMLMGMVGAFLGPWSVLAVLGGGALLGTLYAIARSPRGLDGGAKLPFGTFLAAAAAVTMLAGPRLWAWYLAQFA